MRLLFLDPSLWAYDTHTPRTRPLGGTQSAVCNLSAELVSRGHQVTVINGIAEPTTTDGVDFVGLPQTAEFMNSFDVLILVMASLGRQVRSSGFERPMVLWCHHATDQQAVAALRDPAERSVFQGFAMVSDWQAESYRQAFGVDPNCTKVLRNAIAPSFLERVHEPLWFDRGEPPVMAYTSAPFRGLDFLLMAWPLLRKRVPGARLRVFSSMNMYTPGETKDPSFESLYELCRALEGAEYVGALPQAELAQALATTDILSYPCHFPETSCMAALEAMGAGSFVVASTAGALPETTAGFADLVDFQSIIFQPSILATHYALRLAESVERCAADPAATRARLARQVQYCREQYRWADRAEAWGSWLAEVARRPVPA